MRSALGPNLALVLSLLAAGCTLVGPQRPTPTTTQPEAAPSRPLRNEASDRPAEVGPTVNPVRSFDEVRAVWVVRHTMTSAEAVTEMVENAEAAGINTLLV